MKIEEAMVYLLATSQHGMKTEQIARELSCADWSRGTTAGRRQMKAIIAIAPDGSIYSGQTGASAELEHCIIKFNTSLLLRKKSGRPSWLKSIFLVRSDKKSR